MKAVIRKAVESDVDAVLLFAKQLATSFVVEGEQFKASFSQILTLPTALLLVAESNGRLIGYLLGFEHPAFYANGAVTWVEELYVEEPYRKCGVGGLLMNSFDQTAKGRGCKLVALATRRAESFYQSIGYEKSATYFKKHV